MVSTPEWFTNDGPISTMTSTPVKKTSGRKLLCLFTTILDVKNRMSTCWVGAAKSKRKKIKYVTTSWLLKKTEKVIQK